MDRKNTENDGKLTEERSGKTIRRKWWKTDKKEKKGWKKEKKWFGEVCVVSHYFQRKGLGEVWHTMLKKRKGLVEVCWKEINVKYVEKCGGTLCRFLQRCFTYATGSTPSCCNYLFSPFILLLLLGSLSFRIFVSIRAAATIFSLTSFICPWSFVI